MAIEVTLLNSTECLMEAIADESATQKTVALAYAFAASNPATDWGKCNRAIIKRWGRRSCERIKTAAQKELREMANG